MTDLPAKTAAVVRRHADSTSLQQTAPTPLHAFLLFLADITGDAAPVGLTIGHVDAKGMIRNHSVTIHHASPRITEQITRAYPGAGLVEATETPGGLRLHLSDASATPGLI